MGGAVSERHANGSGSLHYITWILLLLLGCTHLQK